VTISVRCDKCDGEGHYEALAGFSFSMAAEQYYPRYERVKCDECCGVGWAHVEEDDNE
jgi:hypothetical protein